MLYSRYDFGYLVKVLTGASLLISEDAFFEYIHTWFPCCYEIKFMMCACKSLKGGLLKHRTAYPTPLKMDEVLKQVLVNVISSGLPSFMCNEVEAWGAELSVRIRVHLATYANV